MPSADSRAGSAIDGDMTFNTDLARSVESSQLEGKRAVRMGFAGFPYLGLWTKSAQAGFVCIEPWQGVASAVGAPSELADKEGIIMLPPSMEFHTAYTVEAL